MAEMTAEQAIEILNASPDLDKEVLESPFFVLYVRMKIDKARAISALIQRQAIDIERAKEYIGKANSDIDELRTGLEQQAQEIERLNACLQYEQHRTGRQGTHAEDCYKWGPGHWDCAMQEIERLAPVITAAREYDTICAQIYATTEPIPGYMLDVARKARLSLSEALMRMDAASSSAPAGEDAP